MSRKTVVLYKTIPADLRARLDQTFDVLDFCGVEDLPANTAFRRAVGQAHGLIGAGVTIDRALIEQASQLEAISSMSVGVDSYDLVALAEHHITLGHTPDVLTDTVADTALLLMLATARRALELSDLVREGRWSQAVGESLYGMDVHHKRLGIVGMGRIGAAIARRAALGFAMDVCYHNRSGQSAIDGELGARWQSLDTLLAESDIICVTLPLSPATRGLFNAEAFARMRPEALFINIARGGVVDEPALVAALQQGTIRGAGLDVFATEPLPADSPLIGLRNAVLLPHIGSATHETRYRMAELAVRNLMAGLSGAPLPAAYLL